MAVVTSFIVIVDVIAVPPVPKFVHVVPPSVLICHCNVGIGVPVTATVKGALLPASTLWLAGCCVMVGGVNAGLYAVAVMVSVSVFVVCCVPMPLSICTVKVKVPFVPLGLPEVPAVAAVNVPFTTFVTMPLGKVKPFMIVSTAVLAWAMLVTLAWVAV